MSTFPASEIDRLFQQQHWSRQRGCYVEGEYTFSTAEPEEMTVISGR